MATTYGAQTQDLELFASAARTATANGASVEVIEGGARVLAAYLDVTAASGTSPTLDVKLQESVDGTTYTDIDGATFTQKTAAGEQYIVVLKARAKNFVRAVATIGGTTPSFTFKVEAVAIG